MHTGDGIGYTAGASQCSLSLWPCSSGASEEELREKRPGAKEEMDPSETALRGERSVTEQARRDEANRCANGEEASRSIHQR